jgi:serine/threonine-protein kinase SRPK3
LEDIQEKNILLGVEDQSILGDFEKAERESPIPRKIDGDRVIYETRTLDNAKKPGRPVLTDFGEARFGQATYTDIIQPVQYRAPEVVLQIPWDYKVDIWNVGTMVSLSYITFGLDNFSILQIWNLFQDSNMFNVRDANNEPSKAKHLAHMVALLGPPPADFLQRSNVASEYFKADGECPFPQSKCRTNPS